jgi:hypothetical protein
MNAHLESTPEALWIGYDEAEQLRDLLQGIAADEHAAALTSRQARLAIGGIGPSMAPRELAGLSGLLTTAAGSEDLDSTWRDAAGYWSRQVEAWLS